MGTHILDALIVKVVLDTSEFKSGEREVNEATKRLREQNKRTFTEMEDRGKSTAATMKGLRNEVVGLGLAFMGASSLTSLVSGMMSGAASADRLGQTMGMATGKVWAWRMAMKSIPGGNVGEGDAALQSIQRAKMGWQMSGDTGNNVAFSRLGITGNELRNKDAGDILRQLADVQGKMDPQLYASLLQQIGLPASTVAFLQQGKSSVDKLLAQFEKDSAGQEKLAKETEELQQTMASLEATVTKQLVPPLVTIAKALNRLVAMIPEGFGEDPLYSVTGGKNAWDYIGGAIGGPTGKWVTENMGAAGGGANHPRQSHALGGGGGGWGNAPASRSAPAGAHHGDDNIVRFFMSKGLSHDQALGIRAGIEAEGGLRQPLGGGYKGRAIGIGQLLGSRRAEFLKRYKGNMSLKNQLEFMWWELQGGDPMGGGAHVLRETSSLGVLSAMIKKFYRPKEGSETHRDLARGRAYITSHQHRAGTTVHQINNYNIRSTDPKGAAHEVGAIHRRHAVAQVDRGVAP